VAFFYSHFLAGFSQYPPIFLEGYWTAVARKPSNGIAAGGAHMLPAAAVKKGIKWMKYVNEITAEIC
jgi:hypothetical protein